MPNTEITITNPTNDFAIPAGRVQGPSPTTITFRSPGTFRRYAASFGRPEWMEIVQEDGCTVRQGWIAALPADAAAALSEARR
jgi:hypothetical protein